MNAVIETQQKLEELCKKLDNAEFLAVDTEFLRDKTYFAKLCLIQIGSEFGEFVIDCLAPDLNLAPLFALFENEKIVKVFHSCRQDMEVIYKASKSMPRPIFDTQLAAMVLGLGESISYANLVKKLLTKIIDKSSRYTDWSKRPLAEEQILYAANDVFFLKDIYLELKARLKKSGREEWLKEEIESLTNPENYKNEPMQAWQKLAFQPKSEKHLALVSAIASWREKKAQEFDKPRGHILSDKMVLEIAIVQPAKLKDYYKCSNFNKKKIDEQYLNEIIDIVKMIKENQNYKEDKIEKEIVSETVQFQLMRLLLKSKAKEHGVAEKIIISQQELLKIANENSQKVASLSSMKGWRYEIFGKFVVDLKNGKLALGVDGSDIKLIEVEHLV